MTALLIDHDDSFTFNLRSWIKPLFENVRVINHRDLSKVKYEISQQKFNLIVLSPGPKSPQDYPEVQKFLSELPNTQAVFGVCLGLQSMVYNLGGTVTGYTPPVHGKQSILKIHSANCSEFENLKVARYHSLICNFNTSDFESLASTADDNKPMWLVAKNKKWMGVQFHPESFLTEKAELYLQYLKKWMQT
jgi:anthranilate synthase/aminodeoxychorismate synthase-like glutamine amidotransferase